MIKLLKDRVLTIGTLQFCGDGCCSWRDYAGELRNAGEEIDEGAISIYDMGGMVENIDYIYIDN